MEAEPMTTAATDLAAATSAFAVKATKNSQQCRTAVYSLLGCRHEDTVPTGRDLMPWQGPADGSDREALLARPDRGPLNGFPPDRPSY
jgi:hypothetical protein